MADGKKPTVRRTVKLVLAAVLGTAALAGVSFHSLSSSAQPQKPNTTTAASRNAALVAATQDVLKETSEIRQLSILRPVRCSAQSRSEIERMIMKNLDEDATPVQMHAAEVTLKRLGLAPPDFQYRSMMLRLLTEQVAGYYDPKSADFHLADWIDLDGQKPIMAHELTHALQDQHFNLRRFEHWPKGDSDAELAAHSLIEGDATLAMALYVANDPMRALLFLKSMGTTSMSSAELEKAPRALRETLLFPYQEGTDWTRSLYKQNGWERVSKAFTDLPQSTEQILHPEKYFAHEAPVKVNLPDIAPLLNKSAVSETRVQRSEVGRFAESAGVSSALRVRRERLFGHYSVPAAWHRLDYDVQGEWGLYLLLDEFLKSPVESRRAAAGWGGDRLAVYEGPKAEVLIASVSAWDTEKDAQEFFDAYVKRTELRYPGVEAIGTPVTTSSAGAVASGTQRPAFDQRTYHTSEGTVAIELRGARVVIVEGLPNTVSVSAMLRLLTGA